MSNTISGDKSYGCGMHDGRRPETPYETVLKAFVPLLERFNYRKIVGLYRMGCSESKDKHAIPFLLPREQTEQFMGLHEVLTVYREALTFVQMSEPGSVGCCVKKAVEISQTFQYYQQQCQVVALVIVNKDSSSYKDFEALCAASNYPISVIVVALGDGPFKQLSEFESMKGRAFLNYQFVNFTALQKKKTGKEIAESVVKGLEKQRAQMKALGFL